MPHNKHTYFPFINGLRGIAALMVAISHSLLIFKIDNLTNIQEISITNIRSIQIFIGKVLLIFFNGDLAVVTFFLISSLVLSLSLDRQNTSFDTWYRFIKKRFLRLYPTYFSTLLLSLVLLLFFHNDIDHHLTADWFNHWFNFPATGRAIAENVLLRSVTFNINAWTLKIEFYMMIVFPMLVFLKKKTNLLGDFGILIGLFCLSFYRNQHINGAYIYPFYAGLLIPKWGPVIFNNRSLSTRKLFFLFTILLLIASTVFTTNKYLIIALETLSVWYIIGYFMFVKDKVFIDMLENKKIQSLGTISYSFFLLHPLILYLVTFVMLKYASGLLKSNYALLNNLLVGSISIVASLVIAKILYRYIEKPSTDISKRY